MLFCGNITVLLLFHRACAKLIVQFGVWGKIARRLDPVVMKISTEPGLCSLLHCTQFLFFMILRANSRACYQTEVMISLFKFCDVVELFQDGRDMYFDRVNLQRVLLTHEMVSKRAALSFFFIMDIILNQRALSMLSLGYLNSINSAFQ